MVSLTQMLASNALISTSLPPNLVAVFLGGTSGIGESTLKAFVSHTIRPKVYLVGRSRISADRIIEECRTLGPEDHIGESEIVFLQADLSLMKVVERVFTPEGLHKFLATAYYDRTLVMQHLTPLLINGANSSSDGNLDMPALKIPFSAIRGHMGTLVTLTLEASAATAEPNKISFIHGNPGLVRTPYQDKMQGAFGVFARSLMWIKKITGTDIPLDESGERHLFLLTSARYAPGGVPIPDGDLAIGTDGLKGSGRARKVISTLGKYRKEGMVDKVWAHVQGEYERIRRS
ncbi:hypothetical protein BT96DRAFT_1097256 [Gymnopus androsaceus JB14]|uniref:NAD(P)-binding protein n=1 Tax=Gymnopus androsaceus JB14 TaxID=1447944 RepID=A0A6A4HR76_9AGAR|nr:hypothetical protein BT96DRAFT_1097256 [Gymnopus androsaceus JB14]